MGYRETRLHVKEMIKTHKPAILALLETRLHSSRIMPFLRNTGFTDMLVVESLGFMGGIWLLWDCHRVEVEPLVLGDQIISAVVQDPFGPSWILSIVYASPRATECAILWDYVRELGAIVNIPWLLIWDVNQPINACDKRGEKPINQRLANQL